MTRDIFERAIEDLEDQMAAILSKMDYAYRQRINTLETEVSLLSNENDELRGVND
jgi:hypothetical protein